jgi:hypothetical protein
MRFGKKFLIAFAILLSVMLLANDAPGQEAEDNPQEKADTTEAKPESAKKDKDKTGTNPVNFTYDYRFITEMQNLTNEAGSQLKHTMEFRVPLGRDIANLTGAGAGNPFFDMGNMFSLRFRGYDQNLGLNADGASSSTTEVSGIGDFDARLLAIAYASPKFILAPGLEAFFNTASNDALGSGKDALGPVVFAVFPGLVGKRSLFAPGYQYVFSISGDDERGNISRSQIDLYFVWILSGGKNWLLVDPQIILDHENDKNFATIDVEWGFMIVPKYGISGYLRPGWGMGENRPFSYNFEFALKFVWQ